MNQHTDSQPLVSIIIVNFNGRYHLEQCIPSLLQTRNVGIEIIVVDNASTDDSIPWLQRSHPAIAILQLDSNFGFGEANRRGVERSRGEYIAFLNNDTVVDPAWLETLLVPFQNDPEVAASCSTLRLLKHPELLNARGGGMSRLGFGYDREFLFPYEQPSSGSADAGTELTQSCEDVFFPTAAAMLMRKADFENIGGFDRAFFMYHEDVDLGWRLWLVGKRVVVCPDSIIYHYFGGTTRKLQGLLWREEMGMCHNVRSLIKHYEFLNLLRALKGIMGNWHRNRNYAQMWRVLGWNLRHLPDTLAQRRYIQKRRVRRDRELLERGLIGKFRFVPQHPEFPRADPNFGARDWLISPTLLPGQHSALGRLGHGWYRREKHPDGWSRWIAGNASCWLKVPNEATGRLVLHTYLHPESGIERTVTVKCNGSEIFHYVPEAEDWTEIQIPVQADSQGLLEVNISTPVWVPHDTYGGDDFRQLGCRVKEIRFEASGEVPKIAYKSISVVIPTFNRAEILQETLTALKHQTWSDFQVIVVDDGSMDGTWKILQQWHAEHRDEIDLQIVRQENLKPGIARNRGLHYATGDLVLFLGDDVIPETNFLENHVRKHNEIGEPCAVLGFTDWHREKMKVTPFLDFINLDGQQFGYGHLQDGDDVPFTCFYTSNISLPRTALGKDPFDPVFTFVNWEDIELGYRLSLRGLRLIYHASAKAKHLHPMSIKNFLKRQRQIGESIGTILGLHPELEASESMPQSKTPASVVLFGHLIYFLIPIFALLDAWQVTFSAGIYRTISNWAFYQGYERRQVLVPSGDRQERG